MLCYYVDVYLSLNGEVIPNRGYVLISDIGSSDDNALLCHTNRPPSGGPHNSGGDWVAPNGVRVNNDDVQGVARNRGPKVVRLKENTDISAGDPPEGVYSCEIKDNTSTLQTVYVGLYNSERGIYGNVDMQLEMFSAIFTT